MPFLYSVVPTTATTLSTSASNVEKPTIAIRSITRGVDILSYYVAGRGAALTAISGIAFRARRWTTAAVDGTAITPAPRRIGTTALSSCASSESTLTAGTGSGAYQVAFGCGAAGPGGWVAPNPDAAIHVEGGSADEICLNAVSTTASLTIEASAEIAE